MATMQEDHHGGSGVLASGVLPYVIELSEWAQASGIIGMLCYCVMLAVVIVVNIPCGPLELLPGFLFGQVNGFFVALAGKTLGNLVSVWLAKTCLREWAKRTFQGLFLFRVVQRMLQDTGIFSLVLVRTLYMPMGIKNYGLGALDIPTSKIIIASVISGTPFALLWSHIGSTTKSMAEIFSESSSEKRSLKTVLLEQLPQGSGALVAVAALCIFALITRRMRDNFSRITAELREEDAARSKEAESKSD